MGLLTSMELLASIGGFDAYQRTDTTMLFNWHTHTKDILDEKCLEEKENARLITG